MNVSVQDSRERSREKLLHKPGSVAETMAPKKRQSVKKKSPLSCPTTFIKETNPYMVNLGGGDCHQRRVREEMKQGMRSKEVRRRSRRPHPITKQEMTVPMKA